MAGKKKFLMIFTDCSKPLRLLYSLIIYEIVNFLSSFFTLCYFFLSFFLYLKSVPIHVIAYASWRMYMYGGSHSGRDFVPVSDEV